MRVCFINLHDLITRSSEANSRGFRSPRSSIRDIPEPTKRQTAVAVEGCFACTPTMPLIGPSSALARYPENSLSVSVSWKFN